MLSAKFGGNMEEKIMDIFEILAICIIDGLIFAGMILTGLITVGIIQILSIKLFKFNLLNYIYNKILSWKQEEIKWKYI